MAADLTVEILEQIRHGIHGMREDVNQRLDRTNALIDRINERLERAAQKALDLCESMRQTALDAARLRRWEEQADQRT